MLVRRNSAAMSDLCPVVYGGFQTVGLKTVLLRIRVSIYAGHENVGKRTAVFVLIAVLWGETFPLNCRKFSFDEDVMNLLVFPAGNV